MYFALFRKSLNILRIYKIDNIMDLVEKVEKENFHMQLKDVQTLK